jgi:hypothetical protein
VQHPWQFKGTHTSLQLQVESELYPKLLMLGEDFVGPKGTDEGTMQIALAQFLPTLQDMQVRCLT